MKLLFIDHKGKEYWVDSFSILSQINDGIEGRNRDWAMNYYLESEKKWLRRKLTKRQEFIEITIHKLRKFLWRIVEKIYRVV